MAFAGVHIACGFVGGYGLNGQVQSLLKNPVWSETSATLPYTTTNTAPGGDAGVQAVMEIRVPADSYVAISQKGGTPDSTQTSGTDSASTARVFLPANETRHLFVGPGAKAHVSAA